eukprot:Opistho-1_new@4265
MQTARSIGHWDPFRPRLTTIDGVIDSGELDNWAREHRQAYDPSVVIAASHGWIVLDVRSDNWFEDVVAIERIYLDAATAVRASFLLRIDAPCGVFLAFDSTEVLVTTAERETFRVDDIQRRPATYSKSAPTGKRCVCCCASRTCSSERLINSNGASV